MPQIQLSNLVLKIGDDKILNNVNLSVDKGEVIALYGEIGAGKSSLLRLLAGLLKDNFIIIGNTEISGTVGLIQQRPSSQILTFRVDEELATPLSFKKVDRQIRHEKVNEIGKTFDITELLDRDPHNLSSGETQKIVTLTALSQEVDILLFDEPLAFLDSDNTDLIIALIDELISQDKTIIIVDHFPQRYPKIDRYIQLSEGQIISDSHSIPNIKRISMSEDNYRFYSDETIINGDIVIGRDEGLCRVIFEFKRHGLYLITGKNGSGKTTFLLTLSNHLNPVKGEIDGTIDPIFIPQDTYNFFWQATVGEELGDTTEIMDLFKNKLEISPFELSEGERKLLAVNIAMDQERPLIIDEPSQSLNWTFQDKLMTKLWELSKNQLVIISSNDENMISLLNDVNISKINIGE